MSDIENLIALAGRERVSAHTRTTSTGKVVRVSAYTRSPGDLSNGDISAEISALIDDPSSTGLSDAQGANRMAALYREVASRKRRGTWVSPGQKKTVSTPSGDGGNIENTVTNDYDYRSPLRRASDRLASVEDEDTADDVLDSRNVTNPDDVTKDQLSSLGKSPAKVTFPDGAEGTKRALDALAAELADMGGPGGQGWADFSELGSLKRDYSNLQGMSDDEIAAELIRRGIRVNGYKSAEDAAALSARVDQYVALSQGI